MTWKVLCTDALHSIWLSLREEWFKIFVSLCKAGIDKHHKTFSWSESWFYKLYNEGVKTNESHTFWNFIWKSFQNLSFPFHFTVTNTFVLVYLINSRLKQPLKFVVTWQNVQKFKGVEWTLMYNFFSSVIATKNPWIGKVIIWRHFPLNQCTKGQNAFQTRDCRQSLMPKWQICKKKNKKKSDSTNVQQTKSCDKYLGMCSEVTQNGLIEPCWRHTSNKQLSV